MFNLSRRVLSESEIRLLSKGLKFVPTPVSMNRAQLKLDSEEFGRRLKLKYHFRNHVSENFSHIPSYRPPSDWTSEINDVHLEMYLSELEEQLMKISEQGYNYPNLTVEEREALKSLRNDPSIIIKEADKGSAVVIWDREDYIREAMTQLGDKDVYSEIDDIPLSGINKQIEEVLGDMLRNKEITEKVFNHLIINKPQFGRFYLLPKIHKRFNNVPGRPVISNCGTVTENISEFLDFHLKQLIPFQSQILEDSRALLERLKEIGNIPENAILVSFDVVGLYPHIPHDEGVEAMRYYLSDRMVQNVSTESLCHLAKIVLENNFFEFGKKKFKQKLGTAIGTKFAPPYANLFMVRLEEDFLEKAPYKPYLWLRYLDDIFAIWTGTLNELEAFFEYLNQYHPTIKFTMDHSLKSTPEHSFDQINFLDVLVSKRGTKLETDLFSKETDTHQFLHFKSCHPFKCKKPIPYSQAIRIKRICSEEHILEGRLYDLKTWFLKQGYSEKLVDQGIQRVNGIDRNSLLQKKDKTDMGNNNGKVTLVLTYHPALARRIYHILKEAHKFIERSDILKAILPIPPRVAFRNAKSLKDMLVRSKLKPVSPNLEKGNFRCSFDKRCQICPLMTGENSFKCTYNGKEFKINFSFNCTSENVIYLFTCMICGKQYVGSTTTKFRLRFNQYKSNMTKYLKGQRGAKVKQEKLFEHFCTENHDRTLKSMKVQIIDHCDPQDQEKREFFWEHTLDTHYPKGLNIKRIY